MIGLKSEEGHGRALKKKEEETIYLISKNRPYRDNTASPIQTVFKEKSKITSGIGITMTSKEKPDHYSFLRLKGQYRRRERNST